MLKKLTVLLLTVIMALAALNLPAYAEEQGVALSSDPMAAGSGKEADPGKNGAVLDAGAQTDELSGERTALYEDSEAAARLLGELPLTITAEQAAETGHIFRLKEEEPDLNTVIFQNADGTRTAYQYAEPIKYIENGKIKDKSNRIKSSEKSGYAYENEAN